MAAPGDDGTVIIIIGSVAHRFASKAEAAEFLASEPDSEQE